MRNFKIKYQRLTIFSVFLLLISSVGCKDGIPAGGEEIQIREDIEFPTGVNVVLTHFLITIPRAGINPSIYTKVYPKYFRIESLLGDDLSFISQIYLIVEAPDVGREIEVAYNEFLQGNSTNRIELYANPLSNYEAFLTDYIGQSTIRFKIKYRANYNPNGFVPARLTAAFQAYE